MFSTLGNWLTWTTTTHKDEWNTWEEWQQKQIPSHYIKSDIFQYYLTQRPQFQPPQHAVNTGYNSQYYNYCFGDFTVLIVNPNGGGDVVTYLTILLDVYDICKGISRRITGDPLGISLLRNVVIKRSLVPLQEHDFNQYNYNCERIHAHTVAQYSLSTLIMICVSNYMYHIGTKGHFISISRSSCQKAYNDYVFGVPNDHTNSKKQTQNNTTAINIPQKNNTSGAALSWPRDNATCLRCQTCNRVTENIWGTFNACMDCHMKRICSKCAGPPVIISADNLPKCNIHC